jgi:hypothetical protein
VFNVSSVDFNIDFVYFGSNVNLYFYKMRRNNLVYSRGRV